MVLSFSRLTVLQENSGTCETVTKCISGAEAGSDPGREDFDDLESSLFDYEDYNDTELAEAGSGLEREDFDDLESSLFDYEDYNDTELSESIPLVNKTEIIVNEETFLPQIPPNCKRNQKFFEQLDSQWIPYCDCDGYYHPVQCFIRPNSQAMTCWCSTKFGSEISGTRVNVECDEISVIEL